MKKLQQEIHFLKAAPVLREGLRISMKHTYAFEDFVDPHPAELPEDAPRLDKFEQEVSQLRVRFADLKVDFESLKSSTASIDEWFLRHISDLADHAAKEFVQKRENEVLLTALEKIELDKQIRRAVEEMFHREANELAKVIFEALLSKIQPYALKQRS